MFYVCDWLFSTPLELTQALSPPPPPTNRKFNPAFHHNGRFKTVLDVFVIHYVLAVNTAEIWGRNKLFFKDFEGVAVGGFAAIFIMDDGVVLIGFEVGNFNMG